METNLNNLETFSIRKNVAKYLISDAVKENEMFLPNDFELIVFFKPHNWLKDAFYNQLIHSYHGDKTKEQLMAGKENISSFAGRSKDDPSNTWSLIIADNLKETEILGIIVHQIIGLNNEFKIQKNN